MSEYIWRLVDERGQGPYGNRLIYSDKLVGGYNAGGQHPGPYIDNLIDGSGPLANRVTKAHIFGFTSALQARNWWYSSEDMATFSKAGWILQVFPRNMVRGVYETKHQAIFIEGFTSFAAIKPHLLHTLSDEELLKLIQRELAE